jgi:hypothetical protein
MRKAGCNKKANTSDKDLMSDSWVLMTHEVHATDVENTLILSRRLTFSHRFFSCVLIISSVRCTTIACFSCSNTKNIAAKRLG